MQGNAVGEWDLGGVLDAMIAACWGVGLLRLSQRQCGLVEDSHLLAFQCVFHCVCAGPFRASEPEVPGGGALVGWVF